MSQETVPVRSSLLFLCVVRMIVEKHGGHMFINEKNNTFTVNIPEGRKAVCFQELKKAVGPFQEVCESSTPVP